MAHNFAQMVRALQDAGSTATIVAVQDGEGDDVTALLGLKHVFPYARKVDLLMIDPVPNGKDLTKEGTPNDVHRKKEAIQKFMNVKSEVSAVINNPDDITKAFCKKIPAKHVLIYISAPMWESGENFVKAIADTFEGATFWLALYRGTYNWGKDNTSAQSMESINAFAEQSAGVFEVSRFTSAGPGVLNGNANPLYESLPLLGEGVFEQMMEAAPTMEDLLKKLNLAFYLQKTTPKEAIRKWKEYGLPNQLAEFEADIAPKYGDGSNPAYYSELLKLVAETIKPHRYGPMATMLSLVSSGNNSVLMCDQWFPFFAFLATLGYEDIIVETQGAFYNKENRFFKPGPGAACELSLKPEWLADLNTVISFWKYFFRAIADVAKNLE